MAMLIEYIISGIIIVLALIYIQIIFDNSSTEDVEINKELKEYWRGSKKDFIEFKKFEYSRTFSSISEITPFLVFSLTLVFLVNKDIIIQFIPLTIYNSIIIALIIIFFRIIILLTNANKKAICNIKKLYNFK